MNSLKAEFLLINIYKSSNYLTGNTLGFRYKANRLMLFVERVAVYCENRTEHTHRVCGQITEFWCVKVRDTYT
jgi:hypothetical protein